MISHLQGLKKIIEVFETEDIPYMIVGGFAVSYYNRGRTTLDIDIVVQIYPEQVEKIVNHFPDWLWQLDFYKSSAEQGRVFNITDFDSGLKYDILVYQDSEYNWTAFERRRKVDFLGINCFISSPEDLIIGKLIWYNLTKSEKQWGDLNFLIHEEGLNKQYLELWTTKLFIKRHGLF